MIGPEFDHVVVAIDREDGWIEVVQLAEFLGGDIQAKPRSKLQVGVEQARLYRLGDAIEIACSEPEELVYAVDANGNVSGGYSE